MIEIDDRGGIGDSLKNESGQIQPPAPLSARKIIKVNVESVNDGPKIGRRIEATCAPKYSDRKSTCPRGPNDPLTRNLERVEAWTKLKAWPDNNILVSTLATTINASLDVIDVDEDGIFAITPDVMWVLDADAGEAAEIFETSCTMQPQMSSPLSCENDVACVINCQDPFASGLVNSYRCVGGLNAGVQCAVGGAVNTCGSGECKLSGGQIFLSQSNLGEMIVELSVSHGKLSFYPRPPLFPKTLAPAYTILTNMTPGCMPSMPGCKSLFEPCADAYGMTEFDCLFNVSHIWVRTTVAQLQFAIINKYITYVSDLNYFGQDTLNIFVSDQGYTSEAYDTTKTVSQSIGITIVSINNSPMIMPPQSVLNYQRGIFCRTSYMDYSGTQGTLCRFPQVSKVPPTSENSRNESHIVFSDVDLNSVTSACPATCGNLSLILTFERPNSGALRFFPLVPTLQVIRVCHEIIMFDMIRGVHILESCRGT